MNNDAALKLEDDIREILLPSGLLPLGWFEIDGQSALLIGNVGSSQWQAFSGSEQFADDEADPMNRWTVSVISAMAEKLRPELVEHIRYPFGDPNWPFQEYAKQALGIDQSPIGLLIHPEYGLWTAFRAVVIFADKFDLQEAQIPDHPCDTCSDRPCLNTCPIAAFTIDGYDYLACKSHVAGEQGRACREGGCLARLACPVGSQYRYQKPHQAFHMKAYI
ncbi:MAG: hypothetical protein GKR97_09660 [Rhizobiaceae bacterium]|nr:hypothetical protein [Rhizobiaceae bacterium]